jgi:PAS domain-containing protein
LPVVTDPRSAPTQQSLQLILARNLITTLSTPAFIVDPDGVVVFYNEAAAEFLGIRYEETGKVTLSEWREQMGLVDADGRPVPGTDMPIDIAHRERRPVHDSGVVRAAQGEERRVEMLALPLIGPDDSYEGAVGVFWSRDRARE